MLSMLYQISDEKILTFADVLGFFVILIVAALIRRTTVIKRYPLEVGNIP